MDFSEENISKVISNSHVYKGAFLDASLWLIDYYIF